MLVGTGSFGLAVHPCSPRLADGIHLGVGDLGVVRHAPALLVFWLN